MANPGEGQPAPAEQSIVLDGKDAEVWAWRKTITGRCSCAAEVTRILVEVNGNPVPAERNGRDFRASLALLEGENAIQAVCLHQDGHSHRSSRLVFTVRLPDRPCVRIDVSVAHSQIVLDGSASEPGEGTGSPIAGYSWAERPGNPACLQIETAAGPQPFPENYAGERLVLRPPSVDGEYYVSLAVMDDRGMASIGTVCLVMADSRLQPVDWATENAVWVDDAVLYGVVPHNFGPEGFRSVTARLDSLQDLGINGIWLSPINVTPGPGHGYNVADYFELRPQYGTKADFRELVEQAHRRGIRVLMDFVPNHTSDQHRYFQDAVAGGTESPYYDFYDRDQDGVYTYYFHWTHLPNLNYHNPEVENWMLEAFAYWVREFDVDGFRVDVAWGVKQRKPDFWPRWRQALHRIRPDLLLLAEASARDPYYFTEGYDAAYDWTDQLGHWSMEAVFEEPNQIVERLHSALTNEGRGFHPDALIFRFLNNNDTGPRFITRYGLNLTRVAAALLLTLPGIPCIYTGQEVGAEFEPYKTPGPIEWTDGHELRDYYRQIIALRLRLPALRSRHWELAVLDPLRQVYGYWRYEEAPSQAVLVLLNFGAQPAEAMVQVPEFLPAWGDEEDLLDLLSGEPAAARMGLDRLQVPLPPWRARILAG